MARKDDLPDLVVYCNTCKYSKAVVETVDDIHLLECGHYEKKARA